ncbi:TetR/AcrR family transcriptional regulator [Jiangella alba]|uniref:DNA-binding transcriptional regulator, AcrR family n=1 Tax=Jiangella alba TaxID=561176 RepID=A0A1H5PRJ9_9ACTN|nr:TetR/AcrR family transcriptional regulator [Jiangella alba]SEF16324.1 DNA-binding transcriptional regulator, AcrR family [Jiangella alba]
MPDARDHPARRAENARHPGGTGDRAESGAGRAEGAGRPRDPSIDAAVLTATLIALTEHGYTHLSLEDVARRAGTTKPAIRRRWAGRQQLVLAALGSRLGAVDGPDSGCTLCDLDESLKVFVAAFQRLPPDVLGPLLADCASDDTLREQFMTTLFDPPRQAVARTLERARARGDLRPDADLGLVLDLLGALIHYRVLFGHARTGDLELERAVETLLEGIAVDYPALLEHSASVTGAASLHGLHT